jgi:hypothetical protein
VHSPFSAAIIIDFFYFPLGHCEATDGLGPSPLCIHHATVCIGYPKMDSPPAARAIPTLPYVQLL